MKRLLLIPLLFLSSCVGGPDPVRLKAEQSSYALAELCARGWFESLPITEHDKQLVTESLAAWKERLKSDAALSGELK